MAVKGMFSFRQEKEIDLIFLNYPKFLDIR